MNTELLSALTSINACQRNWISDSVSEENLNLLLQVANGTPTKQNVNFFKCIAFTDATAKEELFEICHSEGYIPDNTPNLAPNAVRLLKENKEFIKREGAAWIKHKVDNKSAPFNGFVYEAHKCYRDIGFVVEAYIKDLKLDSNKHTRNIVSKYFDNYGNLQVRKIAELEAHRFIQRLITEYVLANVRISAIQQNEPQVLIPNITAEATDIGQLTNIIIDVINHGLTRMPALKIGAEHTPRNQKNYNTQLLAPVVFMWTANKDETYNRLFDLEYDTDIELTRHQSLNTGISAGAVALAAQLMGYKTGFCGCYNPSNISKWLSTKHGITEDNYPVAILGVGVPDVTKLSNLCVDVDGDHFLRNRRSKDRPAEVLIK
jgi:nitroreductase